jgi:hypothetical protein
VKCFMTIEQDIKIGMKVIERREFRFVTVEPID